MGLDVILGIFLAFVASSVIFYSLMFIGDLLSYLICFIIKTIKNKKNNKKIK